jgi:GTP-binding protein
MSTLRNIDFVTTVADVHALPPAHGAEVAFVGRSNAGKSSALNALAQRKRMAFVSKTPGRTQHINFFRVGPDRYLVDLPGYGYAAVPAATRARWNELIGGYLQTRSCLRGVLLIMDARHPLTALDRQLIAWLKPTGTPVHVLLSKSDKLSRQRAKATLRSVALALQREYANCSSTQLFSSTHKIGIVEAAAKIEEWLGDGRHKNPRLKGSKTGGEALIKIKAPAQGGEAGDGLTPSKQSDYFRVVEFPAMFKKYFLYFNNLCDSHENTWKLPATPDAT